MNGNLKNPDLFLFFAIVSSAIVLILVGTHTYNVMGDVLENSKQAQIERSYIKDIPFFDEVLTNSTLLAATTGDAQWEKRYRLVEPKLDHVIKYLIRLDTLNNLHKILKLTDNANVSLVAMENRVFELVRDRKLNEAVTIMKGSEYAKQKAIYSEGLSTFINLHELETTRQQMQLQTAANRSKWFFGLAILLLAIVWLPVERFLRRSRTQMLKQNQELELQVQTRKESESAMFKSKEQYRLLVESAPDIIFTIANDSTLTSISPAFETLLFWRPDEWIGKPFAGLIHPDDLPLLLDLFQRTMLGEEPPLFEAHLLTKQGNFLFFEFVIKLVRENGEIMVMMGIARHITERKKTEEKLKESEEKYRQLAETSPEMIYLIDTKGYVSYVNKVAAAQFCAPAQELIGKHLKDIFPPDLAQQNFANIQDVIATKRSFQNEVEIVFPTGNRWVDARLTPFFDEKGDVIGVLGLSYDITERKKTEEKLNMLALAIKNSVDCITIADNNYQFIFVNDSFCKVYGFKEEEIVGQPIAIVISKNNLPEIGNDLFSTINKKKMWTGEVLNKRKDGNDFPIQLSLAPLLDDKGELIAVVGVARDITERKHTETEIKKTNAALTKLNAEKDKFFSIIAHDLKSPFNSIIGFSEILVEQAIEKNYQGIEEYTGIILKSSQRAMDLLKNLMEWSRSQTGRMEFNPAYFQMTELINEVELLLDNAAVQKSIVITNTLPDNIAVYADKNMMSAVLRNLISNAIKYTHPGGAIIISAEEKGGLTVSVSDNGIGIPKDRIEQLFRIDENYSTCGTQNERGTGLGLILCKEFIEKHGGKIWVESEEGKGSKFYFTIP